MPPGYGLQHDAEVLLLRRGDGSMVAAFSTIGATPAEVAWTAEADYKVNGKVARFSAAQ